MIGGGVSAGQSARVNLPASYLLTVAAQSDGSGTVRSIETPGSWEVEQGATITIGPFTATRMLSIDCEAGSLSYSAAVVDLTALDLGNGSTVSITAEYGESGSFQPIWADLELTAGAGSDVPDTDFLAPIMGNVLGADLTKDGNYLGGVIGAYSVTGAKGSEFQAGPLLGVVMDGVTDADGAVVAIIDGSDPSSETRATAAFAARMNNNDAGSGVDYGLDLYDAGRGAAMTNGLALAIDKADVRCSNEVCILNGSGQPSDGAEGTGAGFAGPGSLYIRTATVALYINTGTKAEPVWVALAEVP